LLLLIGQKLWPAIPIALPQTKSNICILFETEFLISALEKVAQMLVARSRSANASAFAPFICMWQMVRCGSNGLAGPKGEPDNDEGNVRAPIEYRLRGGVTF